jgi:glutamate-1-semialdehyde 2,1-aminomutase
MQRTVNPNDALDRTLSEAEARYQARHPKSAARQQVAAQHMPGGNTRTVLYYSPFPLAWASGKGNRLSDIDGMEYLDLLGEFSAGLYGHNNAIIRNAIKTAVDDGIALGGPNIYEAQLAAAIRGRFPSIDLIRFTNSGTEANLMALSSVRALRPERARVLVFNGSYHGGVFNFHDGSSPLNVPLDWLIGEYNDVEGTRALLRAHAGGIAAVLVEPMMGAAGCIPGTPEFLGMLREECTAGDIVLIFDEVMTSRLSISGLQGRFRIKPDMTTLGKYLGGGASFGAFGGRRDLLERFDPSRADTFEHPGTFNNNVLSMAAGLAGLTQIFTPAEAVRINSLGDRLREQLNSIATARGTPFQATGVGSLIGLHFNPGTMRRSSHHKSAAAGKAQLAIDSLFHLEMLERGYYFARRGYIALSLPTTDADCDDFATAFDHFLQNRGPLIETALS